MLNINNEIAILDNSFMQKLNEIKRKRVWVKVLLLNLNEEPIEEIDGYVTSGSINIDGDSAVRRSCSFTMVPKNNESFNDFYWTLNSKFKMYVGLNNDIEPNYPDIIWIPQGLFIITQFVKSETLNNITLSIQGRDKMCLLDGTVGGVITANSVDFGTIDEPDEETGLIVNKKLKLYDIVKEAVHEYAKEPYQNIIIEKIDEDILRPLEYRGGSPLYLFFNQDTSEIDNITLNGETKCWLYDNGNCVTINNSKVLKYNQRINSLSSDLENISPTLIYLSEDREGPLYSIIRLQYGETCGYKLIDFTYNGELIGNAGATIMNSVLEPIKKLGNFEYYYDLEGRFVFKEKDNFLYTSWTPYNGTYVENNMYDKDYSYSLIGNEVITAFNSTPNIKDLKNDFSIWGTKKSISGADLPVHMRFAIDKKPIQYVSYDGVLYISDTIYSNEIDNNNFVEIQLNSIEKEVYINLINDFIYSLPDASTITQEQINKILINNQEKFYLFDESGNRIIPTININIDQSLPLPQQRPRPSIITNIEKLNNKTYIKQSKLISVHCDWREIIYQMALDHQIHGQKEDFNVIIAKNNFDPLIGYPTGMTGYEQYYTDILGFWRQLYDPQASWTPDTQEILDGTIKLSSTVESDYSIKDGDYGIQNGFIKFTDLENFNGIIQNESDLREKLYLSSNDVNIIQDLDEKYNNSFNLYCQNFLHESKSNLNGGNKILTPDRLIIDLNEFQIKSYSLFDQLLNSDNYNEYSHQHQAINQFEKWLVIRDQDQSIDSVDFSPFKMVIYKSDIYNGKVQPIYEKYFMANYNKEKEFKWYENYPDNLSYQVRRIDKTNHTKDKGFNLFSNQASVIWDFNLFSEDLLNYLSKDSIYDIDKYGSVENIPAVENQLIKVQSWNEEEKIWVIENYYLYKNGQYITDFTLYDLLGEEIKISFFSSLVGCEIEYLPETFMFLNINTLIKKPFLYGYVNAYEALNLWDLSQSRLKPIVTNGVFDSLYNNYNLTLFYKNSLNNDYSSFIINNNTLGVYKKSDLKLIKEKRDPNDDNYTQLSTSSQNCLQINFKELELIDQDITKVIITIIKLNQNSQDCYTLMKSGEKWFLLDENNLITNQSFIINLFESNSEYMVSINFYKDEDIVENENLDAIISNYDEILIKGENLYNFNTSNDFISFLTEFDLKKSDFLVSVERKDTNDIIFDKVRIENLLTLLHYKYFYYLNKNWIDMNDVKDIKRYLIPLIEENVKYVEDDFGINFKDNEIYKLGIPSLTFGNKNDSNFIDPYWEIEDINGFDNKVNYSKGDCIIDGNNQILQKIDDYGIQLESYTEEVNTFYEEIKNKVEAEVTYPSDFNSKTNSEKIEYLNEKLNKDAPNLVSIEKYDNINYRPGSYFSDNIYYINGRNENFTIYEAIHQLCHDSKFFQSYHETEGWKLNYGKYLKINIFGDEYIYCNALSADQTTGVNTKNSIVFYKNTTVNELNENDSRTPDEEWMDNTELNYPCGIPITLSFIYDNYPYVIFIKNISSSDDPPNNVCEKINLLDQSYSDLINNPKFKINVFQFKERSGDYSIRCGNSQPYYNFNEDTGFYNGWEKMGSITVSRGDVTYKNGSIKFGLATFSNETDTERLSRKNECPYWNGIIDTDTSEPNWRLHDDTRTDLKYQVIKAATKFNQTASWLLEFETLGQYNIVWNEEWNSFYIMVNFNKYKTTSNGTATSNVTRAIRIPLYNPNSCYTAFFRDHQSTTTQYPQDGSSMALIKDVNRDCQNFCYTIKEIENSNNIEVTFYRCLENPIVNISPEETQKAIFEEIKQFNFWELIKETYPDKNIKISDKNNFIQRSDGNNHFIIPIEGSAEQIKSFLIGANPLEIAAQRSIKVWIGNDESNFNDLITSKFNPNVFYKKNQKALISKTQLVKALCDIKVFPKIKTGSGDMTQINVNIQNRNVGEYIYIYSTTDLDIDNGYFVYTIENSDSPEIDRTSLGKAEKLNNKWFKVLVGKTEDGSGGTIKTIAAQDVGEEVELYRYFPADFSNYWLSVSDISDLAKSDFQFLNESNKIIDFDEYGNVLTTWHYLPNKLQLGLIDQQDKYQQRKIESYQKYLYGWNKTISEDPANLNFWFDFLDTEGELGKYSVNKIGSRPKAINESNLGGIYYKDIPNIIYYTKNDLENRQESLNSYTGYSKMLISENEKDMFSESSQKKSIKDRLDELLSQNAIVGESISITTLPIYNLIPNTLVRIQNDKMDGKYLAVKYNIPLGHNGMTSLSMTRMDEGIL